MISEAITSSQLEQVYEYLELIFDVADEETIALLFEGYENDQDKILSAVFEETKGVLCFNSGKISSASFGYLDKFTNSIDHVFKVNNLNYFIQTTIPEFEMWWHHIEWGQLLMKYNKLNVLAARDHGKSHYFSFAYPLWMLYRYERNPFYNFQLNSIKRSKKGMLITNEFSLSKMFLRQIKSEIESNTILKERLYPGSDQKWAETEIECKNGASLTIKSFGSKIRGFHPDWIVADDYLDDSVIYSPEQRNKFNSFFFSVIMNALVPDGKIAVVGTPFAKKDLYDELKKKESWWVFEYPAIFPDGSLLWETRHSIQSLSEKKTDQGSIAFTRENLLKPISSDSTIFPWAILQKSFLGMTDFTLVQNRSSHPKKFERVAIGCDFGISANVGSDATVFVVLGLDDENRYWLLNMWRKVGAHYSEQIAKLKSLNSMFQPDVVMVETNQMQMIFSQIGKEHGLPIVDHTTGKDKYDFKTGLPGLAIIFENGKFRLPRGNKESIDVTDTMCMEFSSITFTEKGKLEGVDEHDDIPMAVWQGVRGLNYVNQNFSFGFV